MDTFKTKAVVAAAKYKSFSRAAEEFSYTPSAFSHMIAAYEESLGVKLFVRKATGVELTDEGVALLPKLESLIVAEKSITDTAKLLSEKNRQELKVGTFSSISRNFLGGIIRDFKKANPDVRLTITVGDDPESALKSGAADIIFSDELISAKGEWFPIMTDRYLAVFPKGVIKEKNTVTKEELYSHPYIFTEDIYLRDYFELSRFRDLITFKSVDDLSVINMVREGLGFAFLPELMIKEHTGGVELYNTEPAVVRTLGFFYKKSRNASPVLNRFIKHLKKIYT